MKYLLYTDKCDVDGVGSAIIGKMLFGDKIDIVFSYYNELDKQILELIKSNKFKDYDRIFITDLSVTDIAAAYVEKYGEDKFILLDHHIAKKELNEFNWCSVIDNVDGFKMSGTFLFAEFFRQEVLNLECVTDESESIIFYLAGLIRTWDTWDWYKVYNDNGIGHEAYLINRLYKLIGREKFIDYITNNVCKFIKNRSTTKPTYADLTNGEYWTALTLAENKLSDRISSMNKDIIKRENLLADDWLKFGYVFNTEDTSEVGHALLKKNPDVDVVCMINMAYNSLSLRSNREGIDLTVYTKPLGGGGHAQAAGCSISKEKMINLLSNLWSVK